MTTIRTTSQELLFPQLARLPYFRALLRAVEARFYRDIDLPAPLLDLGCGDGTFVEAAFTHPPEVGLDPWMLPLKHAAERQVYPLHVQADGAHMPFPDRYFSSVMSNSVLEHIPHLDEVLAEVSRVIQPGGRFVFCVPNHRFLPTLSIGQVLDKAGLKFLGNQYRRFFNTISRHHHCDDPETWNARLDQVGFEIEKYWHYFSPAAFHTLEWGHYFGLPSAILQGLFRRWIIVPTRWNLYFTDRLVRPFYEEPLAEQDGVYTFYITRKR